MRYDVLGPRISLASDNTCATACRFPVRHALTNCSPFGVRPTAYRRNGPSRISALNWAKPAAIKREKFNTPSPETSRWLIEGKDRNSESSIAVVSKP